MTADPLTRDTVPMSRYEVNPVVDIVVPEGGALVPDVSTVTVYVGPENTPTHFNQTQVSPEIVSSGAGSLDIGVAPMSGVTPLTVPKVTLILLDAVPDVRMRRPDSVVL